MSITTNSYVDISAGSITYDRIGLSKTLDNYTLDEIRNYHYCSMSNPLLRQLDVKKEINSTADYASIPNEISGEYNNVYVTSGSSAYRNATGAYSTVYWLDGTPQAYITEDALFAYKMVTEWDASKYVFDISAMLGTTSFASSVWANTWDDSGKLMYAADPDNSGGITYHSKLGKTGDVEISAGSYQPYGITEIDGKILFYQLSQAYALSTMTTGNNPNYINDGYYRDFDDDYTICVNSPSQIMKANNDFSDAGNAYVPPWNWGHPIINPISRYTLSEDNLYCQYYLITGNEIRVYSWLKGKEQSLQFWANCGLHFKAGSTTYKPIIYSGYVGGYTDNLETTSDIDTWNGSTRHDVMPSPPAPPNPDAHDNEIDVTMSAFTPSAGFVRYIEMSYDKLITLASSFNAYNSSIWNIGGDLMKNLISLKVFACSGTHSGIIRNIHIAGHEMTDGNNNPIDGNYINDLGVVELGTIQVGSQFRFNDWRDFAPYTKIECFVPCCGWAQLPPWVMGRPVTGTLYIDLPNGSCKAVIKAGRTPVAEIGGCCAVDMPLSSVATGAKAAGIINSLANGAVAAFNPTPQNLISGSFGIMSAFNANFTETKGTMGDGSNINGCTEFLIKVTRPASTDTRNGEITNRYKHEKGIPCAKTKTLVSGQGFTQIMDANINGAMTDREKQMIIDGFRHGLIL